MLKTFLILGAFSKLDINKISIKDGSVKGGDEMFIFCSKIKHSEWE